MVLLRLERAATLAAAPPDLHGRATVRAGLVRDRGVEAEDLGRGVKVLSGNADPELVSRLLFRPARWGVSVPDHELTVDLFGLEAQPCVARLALVHEPHEIDERGREVRAARARARGRGLGEILHELDLAAWTGGDAGAVFTLAFGAEHVSVPRHRRASGTRREKPERSRERRP